MIEKMQKIIAVAVEEAYRLKTEPVISLPEAEFGDFSTNVAFQLAAELKLAPKVIADKVALGVADPRVAEVSVAGAGFINIRLTDQALWERLEAPIEQSLADKVVVAEYSDPNPFKALHAGHLYTSVVGDAIANVLQAAGARVYRVNFGGDVGPHVAKVLWAIQQELGGAYPDKLEGIAEGKRSDWMGEMYVIGSRAYEDDQAAKEQINKLNVDVYEIIANDDHDSDLSKIYWTCRQWSYDYFEAFYERIGSRFDKYYPESVTTPYGIEFVKKGLEGGVFEKSDGAVVFRGEPFGLHTRVFLTSRGLPTYEAKDAGLNVLKWQDYHFDKSVIITGNDILEYMKVVLKAVESTYPEIPPRTSHITHGQVKLAGGVKMSSRKGNILRAVDVLDAATKASREVNDKANDQMVLAAVKYAFLKSRIGGDIVYDPQESVNILGNSGPYLQYAHARARSILAKKLAKGDFQDVPLQRDERLLLKKLGEYQLVVESAIQELMPHGICGYLYELAQVFNSFYESNRVIGDPREGLRLKLVESYADVLKEGLGLLGIPAPERV